MKKKPNPFENPDAASLDARDPEHASDHPGRDYEKEAQKDTPDRDIKSGTRQKPRQKHPSSGPSGPSAPRRPGTGERQAPRRKSVHKVKESDPVVPGEILYGHGDIEINVGLAVTTLTVVNGADRPIQVGSHFHFAEVNAALEFDRPGAWGKRLNILSGGSVRFEPGAAIEVELVPIQGKRIVRGLRGLCGGRLDG